jgi:hypothetical protein
VVRQWGDGELLTPARDDVLPWELALQKLDEANLFWHVTARPDAHAHVRPVFAVVCDGILWSTTSAGARKARLLDVDRRCSLATSTDGMDVVYDGVAVPASGPDQLQRVAEAYRRKYGWPVTASGDGALDAPFGAPAAGPPPYRAHGFEPVTVWGFGTDERYAERSTRWDFDR